MEGRMDGRKDGRKEGKKELWSEAGEDFPLSEAIWEIFINKYKYGNLCERCKGKKITASTFSETIFLSKVRKMKNVNKLLSFFIHAYPYSKTFIA